MHYNYGIYKCLACSHVSNTLHQTVIYYIPAIYDVMKSPRIESRVQCCSNPIMHSAKIQCCSDEITHDIASYNAPSSKLE